MQDYRIIEQNGRDAIEGFRHASFRQIEVFNRANRGKNVMTPNLIRQIVLNKSRYVVEVAWGRGMTENTIYSVTVVQFHDGKRRLDLSHLFYSANEMGEYLKQLDHPYGT